MRVVSGILYALPTVTLLILLGAYGFKDPMMLQIVKVGLYVLTGIIAGLIALFVGTICFISLRKSLSLLFRAKITVEKTKD